MAKNRYTACDCGEIYAGEKPVEKSSEEFLSNIANSTDRIYCFSISKKERDTESESVVYYDYKKKKWRAGRYIGNIEWSSGGKRASLSISPRFGEKILLEMVGEIFNFKLTVGKSGSGQNSLYIKMLICYIWLQKLSEANRHGMPRTKVPETNRGYTVKGKLLVKPTIFSYSKNRMLISQSLDVVYDEKVIGIISEAYHVLISEYNFAEFSKLLPSDTRKIIREIENIRHGFRHRKISEKDYQSIAYHPIYRSYKELVDFSWQIIKSRARLNGKNCGTDLSGYLIDMAEVWECYVRRLVSKSMREDGWRLIDSTFTVYRKMFYKRKIIPDIVLEKDGKYCVFDAKYKTMQYRETDVDRADFFQIHTYISYMQHHGKVLVGGLLYPIEYENASIEKMEALFGVNSDCQYLIDGPLVRGEGDNQGIENSFLESIKESIAKVER